MSVDQPSVVPLTVGSSIPDLELPDHLGHVRTVSDLVGGDPTLLHFFRGWWCPKERQFFRRLVDLQDDAEVAYTRFVSISVDPPQVQAALRAGLHARWTFLSDERRRYIDEGRDRCRPRWWGGRRRSSLAVHARVPTGARPDDPRRTRRSTAIEDALRDLHSVS